MRKRKAAKDQKAGGKKDQHKAMPESSDNEVADTDAEEGSMTVWRGSAVGGGDDKQQAVYPPAGSLEMTGILHNCTVGDISCASSPKEWRPETGPRNIVGQETALIPFRSLPY
jgi:hypothetical protein